MNNLFYLQSIVLGLTVFLGVKYLAEHRITTGSMLIGVAALLFPTCIAYGIVFARHLP
jgi:hypothetical protein